MRNLVLFGLLILFLVAAQFASGQTVDEIIEKYEKALGGKDKLASIKSIYMEGSREMMGGEVTVKIIKEQGKLSRTEFEMMGAVGFSLVTQKEAWNFFPGRMEAPKKMPDEAVVAKQVELDIAGPLVDYATKGHKTELIGKDAAEGRVCYKIKLTTQAGRETIYWIDAETYLLLKSSAKARIMGVGRPGNTNAANDQKNVEQEMFTLYKDYRSVDGVQIPHVIQMKTSGGENRGGGDTTFDKIEINQPVDAKYYQPQ
jgi:hypothetical protein